MRVTTGITSLDKIIEGGFPSNTVILLSGGPGTGKTLFGLNFLIDGAMRGEKCYYLSVSESKEELLRACEGIESLKQAKKYLGKNLLIEMITLGEKVNLDYLAKIFSEYPQVDRLVIDNVNKLLLFAKDDKEYRIKMAEIFRYLREKVGCSLVLCEADGGNDTGNNEAFESDGVMNISFLDMEEKPTRTLQINKLRYTSFDPRVRHELVISNSNIRLSAIKIL
jgi:circadian clock protein KaiC